MKIFKVSAVISVQPFIKGLTPSLSTPANRIYRMKQKYPRTIYLQGKPKIGKIKKERNQTSKRHFLHKST